MGATAGEPERAALARPLAAITTATVDVQVLRIGAKQMTLAVFRQLHRDDSFDGPLWGTVRYCHRTFDWPCSPMDPEGHDHIVWQDGGELRHGIRRNLDGISSAHSQKCFAIARRGHRNDWARLDFSAQDVVDHAVTFSTGELQEIEDTLNKQHRYDPHAWLLEFMRYEGGTWRKYYRHLEAEQARFEPLPQLFIAV